MNMIKRSRLKVLWLITVAVLLTPIVLYRVPVSASKTFSAEIQYRFIDFLFDNPPRMYFESLLGNRRIRLSDSIIEWVYIDRASYNKLWAESPFAMKEKQYTIVGTFRMRKILAGGYSVAELVDTTHIAGDPYIRK